MKRYFNLFIFILLIFSFDVYATSGTIKQSSVIKCGKTYYGSHGNPKHFHVVKNENDKWVIANRDEVEPPCYADIVNVKEDVTFNKCVDGDTIKVNVNGETKTVRFLAIDTPESVHPTKEVEEFGKEASEYTCNMVKNAKKITLEYDKNSDKEDKYGRLLAYVYADDVLLQERLLSIGYAKVAYLYDDYTKTSDLQKVESVAKEKKLGIWGSSISEELGKEIDEKEIKDEDEKEQSIIDIIIEFISKLLKKLFDF